MRYFGTKSKLLNNFFLKILPTLICLAIVFVVSIWVKANPGGQVQFNSDVIVSLRGISDGSLYIASSSECASFTATGTTLTVNGIPDGSSFILKTPQYATALKLTPSGGTLDLSFSSPYLATTTGTISQWTLTSSGSPQVAQIVGAPLANTWYSINAGGSLYNSFESDNSGQVNFTYSGNLSSSKIFTIALDTSAPPEFDLTSPVDNYLSSNMFPSFSWNPSSVADLDHYALYIDGTLSKTVGSSTNSTSPDSSLACGAHTWYVTATDKANHSTQSDSTFRINIVCYGGGMLVPMSPVKNPTSTTPSTTVSISPATTTPSTTTCAKPASSTIPGIPPGFKFTKNLKYGETYQDVKYLQLFLQSQPGIYPEGKVTGYFGNLTKQAVIRFQLKYEIISTPTDPGASLVGPKTRAKINEILTGTYQQPETCQTTPTPTTSPSIDIPANYVFAVPLTIGKSGNDVTYLQTFLKSQGTDIYSGPITGYFGRLTLQGVARFQLKYHLISSPNSLAAGYVGPATRAKINELLGL